MERQRWQKLDELFSAALDLPERERARFLEDACTDDVQLCTEIEELLAHAASAEGEGFLDDRPELDREILSEDPGTVRGPDGLIAHPLSLFEALDGDDGSVGPWGTFELVEVLGEGGVGRVFRARDTRLGRMVALKVLHRVNPQLARRLAREARAQARINHENVCTVFEVGELEGVPFIAMQLIKGETLQQAASHMSLEQKVVIMAQVAEAMHAAHQLGIVHRDLKPSNIMVEEAEDGSTIPYVLDFGLAWETDAATLTETGDVLGTPGYMAPEQIKGGGAYSDRRADVFSLGACLYSMLAGQHPFPGDSVTDVLLNNLNSEAIPLREVVADVPADVEAIVMKCLDRRSAHRYASARALSEDLNRYLRGEAISIRPSSLWQKTLKKARHHRAPLIVAGTVCAVILGVTGLWLHGRWNARTQAALALRFGQEIERIEGVLWKARSLELHDMEPTNNMVQARLTELEQQIEERGDMALGPGFTALGRGYLALGHLDQARHSLETAWSGGYQTSETAYSLGLTLSRLYRKRLRELSLRRADDDQYEASFRDAVRRFREPARGYLTSVDPAAFDSPAYVEALLAAAEGELELALELVARAVEQRPWLHEAIILEGEVLRELAEQRARAGAYREALDVYSAAVDAFERAAKIGRSDLRVFTGSCSAVGGAQSLRVWRLGEATEEGLQATVEVCEDALIISPSSSIVKLRIAQSYSNFAEFLLGRGRDPSEALRMVKERAHEVLKDGDDTFLTQAHRVLAHALWQQGKHQVLSGKDPTESFALAVDHGKQALSEEEVSSASYQTLGAVYIELALFQGRNGIQHEPAALQAIEMFEIAAALNPGQAEPFVNVGASCFVLATFGNEGDEALERILTKGQENLEHGLEIEPGLADANYFLGNIHLTHAHLAQVRGLDPRPALSEAIDAFENAIATKGEDARSHISICVAFQERAGYEISRGRVPIEDLERAREALAFVRSVLPEPLIADVIKRQDEIEKQARELSQS